MNIRICPSGRFPFAVPFAGGCCGSGCVSVSGNRQPCDDSFCTSCILASICFCLSVSASTLACLKQVVASEYLPAVNVSSARLRSFSIFSCFSRASFVFLLLAVPVALPCVAASRACCSKVSRLVRIPCAFCSGVVMICRNCPSSSMGVPLSMSGTMACPASSLSVVRLGITATDSFPSVLLMLMFRSVPADII